MSSSDRISATPRWTRSAIVALNVVVFWIGVPLVGLALGGVVDARLGLAPLAHSARWMGLAPLVGGAALCLEAARVLMRRGEGMPISSLPPVKLVRSGPYRALRHPIYVGFASLMIGVGLVVGSAGTAFVVVPLAFGLWMATWVALYEEPGLVRRFGALYRAHCRHTGLLVPFGSRRWARALLLWLFRRLVRVRLEGQEHLVSGQAAIYVCDHLSYLDLLLAASCSPGPMAIPVTAEVFRAPLGRWLIGILGGIPRRRYGSRAATAKALSAELAIGQLVGIAVEGERSWTGEMGPLAPGVARFLARHDLPIVPVAMVGSYRLWPRWAPRPDRSAAVTVRVGRPFRLGEERERLDASAIEALVRARILALRDPNEEAVDPSPFPGARPELALFGCPLCGELETLSLTGRSRLRCADCGARWRADGGFLELTRPRRRAGERRTLAAWARIGWRRARDTGGASMLCAHAELRMDPASAPATSRLRSLGRGRALLRFGRQRGPRLHWRGAGARIDISLRELRTVTTERADTLQLAVGDQLFQLVFETASPLRWQRAVEDAARRRRGGQSIISLAEAANGKRGS